MADAKYEGQGLLDAFRGAETLDAAEQNAQLQILQSRILQGDMPAAGLDVPRPTLPSVRALWLKGAAIVSAAVGIPILVAVLLSGSDPGASAPTPESPRAVQATPMPQAGTLAEPDPAPPPARPIAARPQPETPLPSAATPAPAHPTPDPASAPSRRAPAPRTVETSAKRTPPPAATPPPPAGPSTIDADVKLLRQAQSALSSGKAQRALNLARQHRREFPTSPMADVRSVTEAMALCELGRTDDARRRARAFVNAHPGSPLADRMGSVCAVAKGRTGGR